MGAMENTIIIVGPVNTVTVTLEPLTPHCSHNIAFECGHWKQWIAGYANSAVVRHAAYATAVKCYGAYASPMVTDEIEQRIIALMSAYPENPE